MTAYLRVLDVTGSVPAPARLRVLDVTVASARQARLHVDDVTGTTVISLAANAGADQTVDAGQVVQLDGRASSGRPTRTLWEQTGGDGPVVTLLPSPSSPTPTFTAPYTTTGCEIRLTLSVARDDDEEWTASPDEVVIRVRRHPAFLKRAGVLRPVLLTELLRGLGITP